MVKLTCGLGGRSEDEVRVGQRLGNRPDSLTFRALKHRLVRYVVR